MHTIGIRADRPSWLHGELRFRGTGRYLTGSYRGRWRDELRQACQRVVDSLTISPAGADLAVQSQGE
jgi:hypothetical protein